MRRSSSRLASSAIAPTITRSVACTDVGGSVPPLVSAGGRHGTSAELPSVDSERRATRAGNRWPLPSSSKVNQP